MRSRAAAAWIGLALVSACDGRAPGAEQGGARDTDPTVRPHADPEEPFAAAFVDGTRASGVDFEHRTGAFGLKRLPETMGSGVCLFDYDVDGVLDLFFVGGTTWPDGPESAPRGRCALFRGRGDATFESVGADSGADVELYGMGCAAADYDADGDPDLFVTAVGRDVLPRNDGGTFRDAAEETGVAGEPPRWTTAATWLDADRDGDLDLFVGGYVDWSPEAEIFTSFDGVEKVFTTPDRYSGLPSTLYLNRGDGTFELAPFEGDEPSEGKVLGVVADDLDGDGLPEIIAANDTRPNFLFRNLGGGRFAEIGMEAALAYDESGRARAGMGIDVARLDGERPVVAIGNFSGEPLSLFARDDAGHFRAIATRAGLVRPTFDPLTFGLAFLDVDLDGWLDLVLVNGHIEPDIARYQARQRHAQSALLLRGRPDGTFEDVSARAGEGFERPLVGRGLAYGDLDGDGDLDLVVTQNAGPAVLLLNQLQENAPRHYLRVRLVGPAGNGEAIGAVVTLDAGGRRQVRTVRCAGSYLSQSELVVTFGLGEETAVDGLEVLWPDGRRTRHEAEVDRTLVVEAPR